MSPQPPLSQAGSSDCFTASPTPDNPVSCLGFIYLLILPVSLTREKAPGGQGISGDLTCYYQHPEQCPCIAGPGKILLLLKALEGRMGREDGQGSQSGPGASRVGCGSHSRGAGGRETSCLILKVTIPRLRCVTTFTRYLCAQGPEETRGTACDRLITGWACGERSTPSHTMLTNFNQVLVWLLPLDRT